MAIERIQTATATVGTDAAAANQTSSTQTQQAANQTETTSTKTQTAAGQDAASVELSKEGTEKSVQAQSDNVTTVDYLERMLKQMRSSQSKISKTSSSSKKALNYNHTKVSSAIGRAKNLNQASSALTSANSTLSALRRKAASGNYDEDEIDIALQHAKKMVINAKKKIRNLKQEAIQKQKNTMVQGNENRKKNIVRSREARHEMEQELDRLEKTLRQDENFQKNSHRRDEDTERMDADIEYLKHAIELMKKGNYGVIGISGSSGTVTVDTSAVQSAVEGQASVEQTQTAISASEGQTDVAAVASVDLTV
jgi:hypothetical protein